MHCQCHDGWCPGDARSQDISRHGIGPVCPEYSSISSSRVNVDSAVVMWSLVYPVRWSSIMGQVEGQQGAADGSVPTLCHTICIITVMSHERYDISNHQQLYYLLNILFRLTTKETLKLHITVILWGKSTITSRWSPQRASNLEIIFTVMIQCGVIITQTFSPKF